MIFGSIRRIDLDPSQLSAPEKLRLALRQASSHILRGGRADMTAADEAGEGMSDRTLMDADRAEALPAGGSMRVVLVTGMSGAGRSSELRVLEDEGYEAIDNLQPSLLSGVVTEVGLSRAIAVGLDHHHPAL